MAATFACKELQKEKKQKVLDLSEGHGRVDWLSLERSFGVQSVELDDGRPSVFHRGEKEGLTRERLFQPHRTYAVNVEGYADLPRYGEDPPALLASVKDDEALDMIERQFDKHASKEKKKDVEKRKVSTNGFEAEESEDSCGASELQRPSKRPRFSKADLSQLSRAIVADSTRLSTGQAESLDGAVQNRSSQIEELKSPATRRAQGARLVEAQSEAYLSMDKCCGELPPRPVLQQAVKCLRAAQRAVKKQMKAVLASEVKPETRAQLLLSEWSRRLGEEGVIGNGLHALDTHSKGFTFPNAFGEQRPDMSFMFQYNEPAYLATLCEATQDLGNSIDLSDVAAQLKERMLALQPYQRKRTKWTFASMCEGFFKIWVFTNETVRATRALDLSPCIESHGLRAMVSLLRAPIAKLGYRSPVLPPVLKATSGDSTFHAECRISEEPTLRTADVLTGHLEYSDGRRIPAVAKTSKEVQSEKEMYELVRKIGLDGIHTPAFLGTATHPDTGKLYILQSHAGVVLANLEDHALILDAVHQVAMGVGVLASKDLAHGDLNPYNICVGEEGTKLLDLQNLHPMSSQVSSRPSQTTDLLIFKALSVQAQKAPTESSGLESLLYCILWLSLGRLLPWRDATVKTAADVKRGAMVGNARFSSLMEDVTVPALRHACTHLRALFFSDGDYKSTCTSAQFAQVLSESKSLLPANDIKDGKDRCKSGLQKQNKSLKRRRCYADKA